MPSPRLKVSEYVDGVRAGKRGILSRCITLLESTKDSDKDLRREVIRRILPYTGKSIRIGITGTPGVGKSTLLDVLGLHIIKQGLSVAILAIDPSSTRTMGSILGDKTRMQRLAQHEQAFIRPSPSKGYLGGVGQRTKETILLCEAAGYDVVIVETVGVGQSEILISQMTDIFISLLLPGGGDELQGLKKGLLEMSDIIVINKADGNNLQRAQNTMREHRTAQKYIHSKNPAWKTRIMLCSALNGMGILELWEMINEFKIHMGNDLDRIRTEQDKHWIWSHVKETIIKNAEQVLKNDWSDLQLDLEKGNITPFDVQEQLIIHYYTRKK